ncbi:MAG: hypothetical protein KKC75_00170 [Nanoarchaeota archaeon]|nr:hypothetical protein [Nanoarchaeota archaeon]MBU1004887.1 hypothetical protein [Nanoarchaeota archaeon]MBU1945402.1 hypothetical protein [Nanoarchaeota archaeon]
MVGQLENLAKRAEGSKKFIGLIDLDREPEEVKKKGLTDYVLKAASAIVAERDIAQIVPIDLSDMIFHQDILEDLADSYSEVRKVKEPHLTKEDAISYLTGNPAAYAAMLVHQGYLHGFVGGKYTPTGDFLSPVLRTLNPDKRFVSATAIVEFPEGSAYGVLGVADVAVNSIIHDKGELNAVIQNARLIFQEFAGVPNPTVALISSSTGKYNHNNGSDSLIEDWISSYGAQYQGIVWGPCQGDAALNPRVARNKEGCPFIDRPADIQVCAALVTANSKYKDWEHILRGLGEVKTIFLLPAWMHADDLSRGSNVDSVVYTIAAQAVKSQGTINPRYVERVIAS